MAKRKITGGVSGLPVPAVIDTPAPGKNLSITVTTSPAGTDFHRIHDKKFGGTDFHPGGSGNARFSPINDSSSAAIPTMYGGSTLDCALMETAFHDVPYTDKLKTIDKNKLAELAYSTVTSTVDLTLADLTSTALRKMGITRTQLIETEKNAYQLTRPWAEQIHDQNKSIQGMTWVSRQDDTGRAYILFGDRIPADALVQKSSSQPVVDPHGIYPDVVALAKRIGVKIVPGK
jgi:hypothetical protein